MRTQVIDVTPKMAQDWLKSNTQNRPLRRARVDAFHNLYMCGEWKLTHQGIAFDSNGVLKDGQHRLTFISELPPGSVVRLMVSFDMSDDTFGAIDVGARRTPADEMGLSGGLSAVAAVLAKIYNSNQQHTFSLPYLRHFVVFAQPFYEELLTFCGQNARVWSAAPVRAAAVVQMARGHNADFVKVVYRSLVMCDMQTMTPTAQALFRQQVSGKAAGARTLDLFCRSLRAFDSIAPSVSRIQVNSVSETTRDVREFLATQISVPKLKKNDQRDGRPKAAKPAADSKVLRVA